MDRWIRHFPCHAVGINRMIGTPIKKGDLSENIGAGPWGMIRLPSNKVDSYILSVPLFWSQGIELGILFAKNIKSKNGKGSTFPS